MLARMSLLASVVLAGCAGSGADASSAAAPQVRDSAGIRLVEHQLEAATLTDSTAWRMDGAPMWRFASVPREAEAELLGIVGATFLADGGLVLTHRSKQELLVLDASGQFVRSIGRAGDGPGEFRTIAAPWRVDGARLGVYDGRPRRTTTLSMQGDVLDSRSVELPALPDSAQRLWGSPGITTDGALLLWVDAAARSEPGIDRPARWLVVVDSLGQAKPVGSARPGMERYVMPPGPNGLVSLGYSPFAASPLAAPCGREVITADNQSYAVVRESLDGKITTIIRSRLAPRLADSADYAAAIRAQYPTADVSAESIEPLRRMTPSGLVPVLRSIQCDEVGNMWVEEQPHDSGRWRRLIAYTPAGERRLTVLVPSALRLLTVRSDAIAVVAFDEDGQERVEVYRAPSAAGAP